MNAEINEELQVKPIEDYSLLEKYWFCFGVDTANNQWDINGVIEDLNFKDEKMQLNNGVLNSYWQINNEAEYEDEYLNKYSEISLSEGKINTLIIFRHWKSEIWNLLQQKEAPKNLSSK